MEILKRLGITIKDKDLYDKALTHSSYTNEQGGENYERLEFLGDAVLQIIMSEYYYLNTNLNEGEMSKERARYVCEIALATYARKINLQNYICYFISYFTWFICNVMDRLHLLHRSYGSICSSLFIIKFILK